MQTHFVGLPWELFQPHIFARMSHSLNFILYQIKRDCCKTALNTFNIMLIFSKYASNYFQRTHCISFQIKVIIKMI